MGRAVWLSVAIGAPGWALGAGLVVAAAQLRGAGVHEGAVIAVAVSGLLPGLCSVAVGTVVGGGLGLVWTVRDALFWRRKTGSLPDYESRLAPHWWLPLVVVLPSLLGWVADGILLIALLG